VAVSERAWQRHAESTLPRYYWDFSEYRAWMKPDWTESPWTPAISVIEGLAASLATLRAEPLERIFELHRLNARAVKAGVRAIGLELFGENAEEGVIVTAVRTPDGIDPGVLADHLEQRYNTMIAAGQGPLKADVFRIGHLGHVAAADVAAGLAAVEAALGDLGGRPVTGAGVAAAVDVYRAEGRWPCRPPLDQEPKP
jgi:aspartate aminotransferase-like enzyme